MALSLQVENHAKAFPVALNALHRVHVPRAVASRSTDDYSRGIEIKNTFSHLPTFQISDIEPRSKGMPPWHKLHELKVHQDIIIRHPPEILELRYVPTRVRPN
jgi:hypothetical protein